MNALTAFLNDDVPKKVRLCTPSVIRGVPWIDDVRASDVSVSCTKPGALVGHTGLFADLARLLADVHGARRALVITNGSTGANQIALAAYARLNPEGIFLVDRQCHHSMPSALTFFGLDWAYIPNAWDPRWEVPAPASAADVAAAIRASRQPVACVVVTSPTYAGECADIGAVVRVVAELAPEAFVHVDQAWGSHLPWVRGLDATTAMAAGADSAAVSLHKQAGCIQPGAALMASDRVPGDVLDAAYAEMASTSQSLIIAASIEASQGHLARHGRACFDAVARRAARLKRRLRASAPSLRFLDDERPGPHDPTKVTLSVDAYATTGYAVATALERDGIVAEKASPRTLTFLVTLSATRADVARAAATTAEVLRGVGPRATPPDDLASPYDLGDAAPVVSPTIAVRRAHRDGIVVGTEAAVGRIAADRIEAYPPGTAVVFEGFRVTAGAIRWLRTVRAAGGSIVARDTSLQTIRVLPEEEL